MEKTLGLEGKIVVWWKRNFDKGSGNVYPYIYDQLFQAF